MDAQQHTTITLVLPALLVFACSKDPEEEPDLSANATSEEGGSEEFGAANDEVGENEEEISANTCLTSREVGSYGIRHHCGGEISFSFSESANDVPLARDYGFGFGPTYASDEVADQDTYAQPMVAACCGGPFDFEESNVSQKIYFENCKLDAAQQICSATDQYLEQLAMEYPAAAPQLLAAAEILGSAANQQDCVLSLYEAGEFDSGGNPITGK